MDGSWHRHAQLHQVLLLAGSRRPMLNYVLATDLPVLVQLQKASYVLSKLASSSSRTCVPHGRVGQVHVGRPRASGLWLQFFTVSSRPACFASRPMIGSSMIGKYICYDETQWVDWIQEILWRSLNHGIEVGAGPSERRGPKRQQRRSEKFSQARFDRLFQLPLEER